MTIQQLEEKMLSLRQRMRVLEGCVVDTALLSAIEEVLYWYKNTHRETVPEFKSLEHEWAKRNTN